MTADNFQSILKQYWGYDDFRGIQREIIESVCAGFDTLGLMPTGGGKSITFQVPALAMEGTCIVITPLIALMKDQVQHLRQRGIKAAAIYSGMQHSQILTVLENAVFGAVKILYVSPERLASELFLTKLSHMHVSFITVDEAHCISQWGYDFRPSYLTIADIRRLLPGVPVLALTATATPAVVADICDKLQPLSIHQSITRLNAKSFNRLLENAMNRLNDESFSRLSEKSFERLSEKSINRETEESITRETEASFQIFRMSFERRNLAYIVRQASDKYEQLIQLLQRSSGSAIVYVRSRRRTKEIADLLGQAGFTATYYHAGLDHQTKDQRQNDWQQDRLRIIVATNAFGMGIDKPDVRMVIHADCPDSIEAYFQEAGRAGRDGQPAQAVLLYNGNDRQKLLRRIAENFPEKDYIKEVYEHLAYYYQIGVGSGYNATFEFNIDDFCHRFHHFPVPVDSSLKILSRAGYIEYYEEQENQARVMFTLERDDLYRLRNNTPDEDRLITAMLRNYGGLFVDYCYIDESLLARQTGFTLPQVYMLLVSLRQKRVLNFIPQKKSNFIRYTQRREDKEHVQLMPEVYEQRREQFEQRINAMIDYLTQGRYCRSRLLLRYFGEDNGHDCGLCDVCQAYSVSPSPTDTSISRLTEESINRLNDKTKNRESEKLSSAAGDILHLLSDGHRHHITELQTMNLSSDDIDRALSQLLEAEKVYQDDGFLTLA